LGTNEIIEQKEFCARTWRCPRVSEWGRVLPLLERQVQSVTPIELPGRAGYGKPVWRMKLEDYADAVVKEVGKIAAPTILVGHSMGGQAQLNIIVILGSVHSLK